MKKFLKIVGIIAAVILVIVLISFAATSALPKAADAFFQQVARGDMEGAYQSTASGFRAATSLPVFQAFLQQTAITDYQKARWTSRSIENSVGTLEGVLALRGGGRLPVHLTLVKENDTWKMHSIEQAPGGVDESGKPSEPPRLPNQAELNGLVGETMEVLALAIKNDDFERLHRNISGPWRRQITPAELRNTFMAFVEHQVDLTDATRQPLTITGGPALDDDGLLVVQGTYALDPYPVHFRMRFFNENGAWKAFGLGLDM